MRTNYKTRELHQSFGDKRLDARFENLCEIFSNKLHQPIPNICENKAQTKATYRFLEHQNVKEITMLQKQISSINVFLEKHNPTRILQISDTVELDYTNKKGAKDLGSLNYVNQKGMLLQTSLLTTTNGLPIGLLHQNYISRSSETFGQSATRESLPFEEKESYRWLEHFKKGESLCNSHTNLEVVYIADSESDLIELYQNREQEQMHFLIRSKINRKLADKSDSLYSILEKQASQGQQTITILNGQTNKERNATLEFRFCPVELTQHRQIKNKPDRSVVSMYAIKISEINTPADVEQGIEWFLLTTLPIETFEQALEATAYYILRWLIERFHFLLKSGGAEVEKLQLTTAQRLKNAITLYSISIIKAMSIRYWAEKSPASSIDQIGITDIEHKVLYTYAKAKVDKKIVYDAQATTVNEFCIILGKIAGFNPSKRQPLPGFVIITRALEKLKTLVDAYDILCQ